MSAGDPYTITVTRSRGDGSAYGASAPALPSPSQNRAASGALPDDTEDTAEPEPVQETSAARVSSVEPWDDVMARQFRAGR